MRRTISDSFLRLFLDAQEGVYDTVLDELLAGRKSSHWIWFIFPQIAGLGHSAMAQQFSIASLDEAKTYLQHPTLGPRLRACTQLVLDVSGLSAEEIFSYPDYLKFRSCMTLFLAAATDNSKCFICSCLPRTDYTYAFPRHLSALLLKKAVTDTASHGSAARL